MVVPTYRRPDALGRCLDALAGQTEAADEILIVARREDDVSQACVQGRQDDSVRLVLIDVPPGRPGFVAALNAGIADSTGDIVFLTDDDSEPWPDWIARALALFASDPSIGAVGGRDWVYIEGRLEEGAGDGVGSVTRWGRVIGRHHLGVGPARDVAVLKGVNLSARGDLIRGLGFDRRLRGRTTEHHSELGFCLKLLQMGHRVVYDPAIAVDHRPQPRTAEVREFDPEQVRNAAFNETLALLEYLSLGGRLAHLLWSVAIGTRTSPGFGQSARLLLTAGNPQLRLLLGNLQGRALALRAFARSRR